MRQIAGGLSEIVFTNENEKAIPEVSPTVFSQ